MPQTITDRIRSFKNKKTKNEIKQEEKLNQILKRTGPTKNEFPFIRLTDSHHFSEKQQEFLFENFIDKMNQGKKWVHNDYLDKWHYAPNKYKWKTEVIPELTLRYEELIQQIPHHQPIRGKKDIGDVNTRAVIPVDNWEKAKQTALQKGRHEDITLMLDFDRRLYKGNIILTTPYHAKSGRIYNPIQNLCRPVRQQLLKGKYDYDIETALPSVIYQLHPWGSDLILKYIQDKNRYRNHLVDILEVKYDIAKQLINALFFGIRVNGLWIFYNEKEMEWFTTTAARLVGLHNKDTLMEDEWFKEFATQVRVAIKNISDQIKRTASKINGYWVVVNPNGDKLVLSKWKLDPKTNKWKKVPRRWSGGHVMCHHYFGIERLIIQQLNLPTDDLVLIHDGFVINEKINFPETFKIESLNLTLDIKFSEAIL